jgi:histidine triad (HIT) family protein
MTIFEKIIQRKIPAKIIFENSSVLAFEDIAPQAKVHLIFIHKEKSEHINELMGNNPDHIKDLFLAIKEFTEKSTLVESGFRVVTNCGPDAGQSVFYTHLHVLGGEPLGHFGVDR